MESYERGDNGYYVGRLIDRIYVSDGTEEGGAVGGEFGFYVRSQCIRAQHFRPWNRFTQLIFVSLQRNF